MHVKEKLQKRICSAFCLCVFDNKTLLEIVSYDWCPCDSYINTFYFLNLIYQYTVMSDTTLFTKNTMFCMFVFCMVICFQLIAVVLTANNKVHLVLHIKDERKITK